MTGSGDRVLITGTAASPGVAAGPAFVYDPEAGAGSEMPAAGPDLELARFHAAQEATRRDIQTAIAVLDESTAAIFQAHLLMLDDPELVDRVESRLQGEVCRAEQAVAAAIKELADTLRGIDDEYLRSRVADIEDLGARMARHLAAASAVPFPAGCIVLSRDLSPSDVLRCSQQGVAAAATEAGSVNAHASILARSLRLPLVTGAPALLAVAATGLPILVNGDSGEVVITPGSDELQKCRRPSIRSLSPTRFPPARTADGRRVRLYANLGRPEELEPALAAGAEGVGVLRTEFLFLDAPADEETQYHAYRALAEKLSGKPLIIRTLDIGGDKPIPWLPLPREDNPYLGHRGIRLSLSQPRLLDVQLRAILRAAAYGNVLVMFPMVTNPQEMSQAKAAIEQARQQLTAAGVTSGDVVVGMMVETPAAAVCADLLAEEAAFLSVGTNDLAQYTLAADRNNPSVAGLYDQAHPAVMRLLAMVVSGARRRQRPVSVCGELAADTRALPLLVGLGVTEFSVSPAALLDVRQALAKIDYREARAMARRAVATGSA
jgi:phosphoenolpyruvate-protein phosphotransferase (PTS system enzyme I)